MTCCSCWPYRPGNRKACYIFSIPGVVLLIGGCAAAILGAVGVFSYNDFFGYVGGASMFFGIMFILLWYMYTIPLKPEHEKQMPPYYQPPKRGGGKKPPPAVAAAVEPKKNNDVIRDTQPGAEFIPLDDARKSSIGASSSSQVTYDNVAYEKETELPQADVVQQSSDDFDRDIKSRSSNSKNSVAPASFEPSTSYNNPVYAEDEDVEIRSSSNLEAIANNFSASSSTYQPIM